MRTIGLIFLIIIAIAMLQFFLSTRRNKFIGLIIPGINLLGSIIVSLLFTDIYASLLALVITIIPFIIWYSIYKICRKKLNKKNLDEIKLMKIKDL